MSYNLKDSYTIISPEVEINEFIETNENTLEILNVIKPQLIKFFPIPKSQKVEEIIEYCKKNPLPDISDLVYELQLDLFDADDIID